MLQFVPVGSTRQALIGLIATVGLLTGCGDDAEDPVVGGIDSTTITLPTTAPLSMPEQVPEPVTVEQSANGSTVRLTAGQRLIVRLRDPSLTERWAAVDLGEGVLATDGTPRADGDATVWTFRAVGSGQTTVRFAYAPATEPPIDPAPIFTVEVTVS